MMIISRNYQCILLCIIELSLSSFVWCAFLMTDTYRAISGCNKDRKHTGSSAIYNSRSQLDCASKCSETFDCTGINHCLLSGVSTCDLMYVTSRPPSCNVLKPQEGCTYFHKVSNSYTMGCLPVRKNNSRALASGLSYVQMDKHGITILYHLHKCRSCTSRDISF